MKQFFIKAKNLSLITIITGLVTGLVLLIKPEQTVQFVSILCGVTIILLGVGAWVSYLTRFKSIILTILGTLAIIGGIVLCVNYKSIISIVLMLFGIFVIVSGVTDFICSIEAKRAGLKSWGFELLIALVTIALGAIAVINPFDSVLALTQLLGVSLIVYAVMDLICFVQLKRIVKISLAEQIDSTAQEHEE
jgi:uncharacterized membrane protein HdeD (DUF308 family)